MCGISGIFGYGENPPDNADELARITAAMSKRGPDGHGVWSGADGRVWLGHRRLSVIDLSDAAAQPMVSSDGALAITFNGEIYNYRELRRELEGQGHTFRTQSDTEVLLQLYASRGERMVTALRGMFAFCLWDSALRRLLLARDPYGIKPLYYADDGRTFRLASQVKALVAGGRVRSAHDPAGLVGFLLTGAVPEPHTIYKHIKALPAGSLLWVDSHGAGRPLQYFSIAEAYRRAESERSDTSDDERQDEVRSALLDSVRHHLVSDVPVAAFLSGGIDSGALIGLMRDAGQASIQTITLAFDEFRGTRDDEAPAASQLADLYGTSHTLRVVSEREFWDDLPSILAAMDQPSVDGVNTWFVSKSARELGIKVAISGLGGDELFGGYSSFREIPRIVSVMSMAGRLPWMPEAVGGLARVASRWSAAVPVKAAGLPAYGRTYPGAYFLRRGLFMPGELEGLLDAATVREGLGRLFEADGGRQPEEGPPTTPFGRVAALESTHYMRNQLLRDADWASMAHSVEVRVPLVDTGLLARTARIMVEPRKPDGKTLLGRSPSRPLPTSLLHKRKSGFGTPIGTWLARAQAGRDRATRPQNWVRLWARELVAGLQATQ